MSDRPGCLSGSGALIAGITLVGLLAWTLVSGPVLFSPGQLNSKPRTRALGGVESHAWLAADCGACHTAPWDSRTMADRCLSCHTEIGTQIRAKQGLHGRMVGALSSPTCRGCHTEHNGPNGALTVLDAATFPHDLTGYSLRGHRRTATGARFACADCHPKDLAHFDQITCAACHAALDAAFMSRHVATFGRVCLICHNGSGRDGADFDHGKLTFKLTGKHANVACERCHSNAGSLRALRKTPQDCLACHAKDDKHRGAFGQRCGQCHTPDGWGNATFAHTIFPVDHGKQERAATCQTCHPNGVSTYTCYGCHAHTPATVQSRHEGRTFVELADCVRCHAGGGTQGGD